MAGIFEGVFDGVQNGLSSDGPGAITGGIIGAGVVGGLGQATGVPGMGPLGAMAGGIVGSKIGEQFDGPSIDPIQAAMDKDTDGDGINDYFDTDNNNNGIPDEVERRINEIPNYLNECSEEHQNQNNDRSSNVRIFNRL